jgi:hypothetical protein
VSPATLVLYLACICVHSYIISIYRYNTYISILKTREQGRKTVGLNIDGTVDACTLASERDPTGPPSFKENVMDCRTPGGLLDAGVGVIYIEKVYIANIRPTSSRYSLASLR